MIVACCDSELLGKTLNKDGLELKVSEAFYGNVEVTPKQAVELFKDADSINLIGQKSVFLALESGLIVHEDVKKVAGVEHAIIIKV